MYCAWHMCQVLCIYYLMLSASFLGRKWDSKKVNDVLMAPVTQIELGLTSDLCSRKASFLSILVGNSTDDLAVCQPAVWGTSLEFTSSEFYSPSQICGWLCLLSCEVLGGMTTSIWALISQVLVLAHVPAKVSQEVTKSSCRVLLLMKEHLCGPLQSSLVVGFLKGACRGHDDQNQLAILSLLQTPPQCILWAVENKHEIGLKISLSTPRHFRRTHCPDHIGGQRESVKGEFTLVTQGVSVLLMESRYTI